MSNIKTIISILAVLAMPFLNGCAFDVIRVKQTAVKMKPAPEQAQAFTLRQEAEVQLATGYKRKLNADTKWVCVGSLPQGEVYKSDDQVLTIEGSNIYEANMVVSSNKLVGFYLPVEGTYSSLDKPMLLEVIK